MEMKEILAIMTFFWVGSILFSIFYFKGTPTPIKAEVPACSDWRVVGVALDRPELVVGHYLVYLEQEGTKKRTVVPVMGQPVWSVDPESGQNVISVDRLKDTK